MPRYQTIVLALIAAALMLPPAASAAAADLAFDSVTKFVMNGDPPPQQPGDFNADFATAAAVQMPEQGGGGGFFSQIGRGIAMGKSMQEVMHAGMAERHYVAGSKERIDNLTMQTATIVDCSARTITTLDLRRKTYKTVSMDQGSESGGAAGASPSDMRDNGTRIAIAVNNTALGSRQIGGQDTNGYRADMTITETSASGESHTQHGNLLSYFSSIANPAPSCSHAAGPNPQMGSPMLAGFAQVMSALTSSGSDRRVSIKQSGPPLPLGKLAMFSTMNFAGGPGSGMTFVTERGNVRSLSANDPVFAIPPDFTQQQ